MKRYILIAGVNGAGKSTLYQSLDSLQEMSRVNTDEIVKIIGSWRNFSDVIKAGKIAVRNINKYFSSGISFNQETTLCGNSIIKNIERAKSLGYFIELHYVGIESADLAKERIARRVMQGGHGVPDKDVERRYTESFEQLIRILPECNLSVLYDNTESFKRFATYEFGKLHSLDAPVPEWYKKYIVGVD